MRPLVPLAVCSLTALTLLDHFNVRFLHPYIPPALQSQLGEISTFEGVVVSPPESPGADGSGFRTVVSLEGTKILLRTGGEAPPSAARGDLIRFQTKLKKPAHYQNPGSFDYRLSLERQGILLTGYVEDAEGLEIVQQAPGGLLGGVDSLRRAIRIRFSERLPAPESGFLSALIAGDRSGLTPELWEDFRRTGTAHLIAISGQHIAIVAALAYGMFLWLLKRSERLMLKTSVRVWSRGFALLPVFFYTLLAGSPPSAIRAAILATLLALALGWRREVDSWSALALAALLITAMDPAAPFSASFQLSFLAVLGILMFRRETPGCANEGGARPAPTRTQLYLIRPLWMSVGATLATSPLVAYRFHQVSLSGILTNAWAIPAVGVLLVAAAAALVAPLFMKPLGLMTHAFLWALHRSSDLSWVASFYPTEAELLLSFLFVVLAAWVRWRPVPLPWKQVLAAGSGFVILSGFVLRFDPSLPSRRDLQVTFLDVGQGDAALVVTPSGKSLLVDGGGFLIPWGDQQKKTRFDVGEREVVPYLKRLGLKRIDAILLSHPHPDHFGGLAAVIRSFPVGEFWWSGQSFPDASFEDLTALIRKNEIPQRLLRDGDHIPWNGCDLDVFYPEKISPARTINDNSLVVRLSYGKASILFPGDIEKEGEAALSDSIPVSSTILKIPHHGSKTSSSVPFIDSVRPQYAVASLGEGNLFGFPHEGILEKYERRDVRIFRTDRDGAVTFRISPDFPKIPISIQTASSRR